MFVDPKEGDGPGLKAAFYRPPSGVKTPCSLRLFRPTNPAFRPALPRCQMHHEWLSPEQQELAELLDRVLGCW